MSLLLEDLDSETQPDGILAEQIRYLMHHRKHRQRGTLESDTESTVTHRP